MGNSQSEPVVLRVGDKVEYLSRGKWHHAVVFYSHGKEIGVEWAVGGQRKRAELTMQNESQRKLIALPGTHLKFESKSQKPLSKSASLRAKTSAAKMGTKKSSKPNATGSNKKVQQGSDNLSPLEVVVVGENGEEISDETSTAASSNKPSRSSWRKGSFLQLASKGSSIFKLKSSNKGSQPGDILEETEGHSTPKVAQGRVATRRGDGESDLPFRTTSEVMQHRSGEYLKLITVEFLGEGSIGMTLSQGKKDRYAAVKLIKPGTLAEACGAVAVGDLVLKVNRVSVKDKTVAEIAAMMMDKPVEVLFSRHLPPEQVPLSDGKSDGAYLVDVWFKDPKEGQKFPVEGRDPPPPARGWRCRAAQVLRKSDAMENAYEVKFKDRIGGSAVVVDDETDAEFCFQPYLSKSPKHVYHHPFRRGDVLDVECVLPYELVGDSPDTWYKCQVLKTSPYYILVRFVEFGSDYDRWYHVVKDKQCLAEFGTETERQQKEVLEREERFEKLLLSKRQLKVTEVEPDGNCMFRAIAFQLLGDQDKHMTVRRMCCDYMMANKDRFCSLVPEGEFEEYVDIMREERVWGDDPEIRAMEELFDRPMEIYSSVPDAKGNPCIEPLTIHFEGDLPENELTDVEPIMLSYHGNNHYNAVAPVDRKGPLSARRDNVIREHRLKQMKEFSRTSTKSNTPGDRRSVKIALSIRKSAVR